MVALSNEVYNITSPPGLSVHVFLRKLYSVVAFALVGAAWAWAWPGPASARIRVAVLAIATYSGLIEIGQKLHGSEEGPFWNGVDVACGAVGGALGGSVRSLSRGPRAR